MKIYLKMLVAALSALAIGSCGTASKTASSASGETIKVMSYNVRLIKGKDGSNSWEFRKGATPLMLADVAPDVFGVQEAFPEQAQYILDNCPQYEGYGIGRNDGVKGERTEVFWNKKKFKALDMGTFWLSETPEVPSKSWDSSHPRTATWVLLQFRNGGRKFFMVNTHLDHKGWEARRIGLQLIEERIAGINKEGLPIILTGDFNIHDDHQIILDFNKRMNNARLTSEAPIRDINTFHGWGKYPNETERRTVIDYIYYKGFAKCRSYNIVDKSYKNIPYCSDHYPIYAVLEF